MIIEKVITIKIIFFDTETTGLNSSDSKIIELAMLTVDNNYVTEEYDKFININERLSEEITELTGITDEMLINDGVSEKTIADDLKERLTPGTLMIAHNAQFDLSFIYELLNRHYPDDAYSILAKLDWIDSLTVLKDRKKYPHKLQDAVEHYNIGDVNYHRAIDDTKALLEVTSAMKNERDDLSDYCNVFGFNPKYGVSGFKFDFIEYKPHFYNNMMVKPWDILPNK